MSAGEFVRSFYEADSGEIHPIRVQPETIAANIGAVNSAAGGPATSGISARVSGGARQLGLTARKVRVQFTGTAPASYLENGILTIPALTPAAYDAAVPGTTGTYLSQPIVVVGRTPESVR